jgi:integrase/recombinase XerC
MHGKGDQSRVVGVDRKTQELIDQWLFVRPASDYLFCTMKGKPMQDSYVRHLFKRLQEKEGISKRCHPHGMRHTGATELAKAGVPLIHISTQLGHKSTATTDTYIRHLCPEEVVKIIREREW